MSMRNPTAAAAAVFYFWSRRRRRWRSRRALRLLSWQTDNGSDKVKNNKGFFCRYLYIRLSIYIVIVFMLWAPISSSIYTVKSTLWPAFCVAIHNICHLFLAYSKTHTHSPSLSLSLSLLYISVAKSWPNSSGSPNGPTTAIRYAPSWIWEMGSTTSSTSTSFRHASYICPSKRKTKHKRQNKPQKRKKE